MIARKFTMRVRVWLYPGMAGWHFITVPKKQSETIRKHFSMLKRGWSSLCVSAQIGMTRWETSIFPDKKTGTYLLPIKSEIRKEENVQNKDMVTLTLEIKTS